MPVSAIFENLKGSSADEVLENFSRHPRAGADRPGFCGQERGAASRAIARCMKILLDESTLQKLRLLIDNRHVVVTTWFQGWSGLKNGARLAAAEEAGFDLFITR